MIVFSLVVPILLFIFNILKSRNTIIYRITIIYLYILAGLNIYTLTINHMRFCIPIVIAHGLEKLMNLDLCNYVSFLKELEHLIKSFV